MWDFDWHKMDIKLIDRILALGNLVGYARLAYVEADVNLQITSWNPSAKDLFGYSEDHCLGRFLDELIPVSKEKLIQCRQTRMESVLHITPQGNKIQCEIYYAPIINLKAEKRGIALLAKDVSSRFTDKALLNQQKKRIQEIYGFAPIGIYHVNMDGNVIDANSEYAWMLGYESSEAVVSQIKDFSAQTFYDPEKAREFMFGISEADQIIRFRCRLKRKDNSYIWAQCYAKATHNESGRRDGFIGFSIDISETIRAEEALKNANEKLKLLSLIDGLTQIPNRRKFDECLASEWNRHQREKNAFSLILCDIDFFKFYNDTYGHQAGDECLKTVAKTIHTSIHRSGDLAARYGGEEFAVILPDTGLEGARVIAERIRTSVQNLKIEHKTSKVDEHITLSLGISTTTPGPNNSAESLVAFADKALYQAKAGGRNQIMDQIPES